MRFQLLALSSISLVTIVFACSSSDSSNNTTPPAAGQSGEQLFRAMQPDLIKNCGGVGGACHINGTHKNAQGEAAALWLGPGDPYAAAKGYVGIIPITGEPGDSKLLTQVEHDGPALVSIPPDAPGAQSLYDQVKAWVTVETAALGAAHPVTDAFYIKDGPNTLSLAKLAPTAAGAQLTFTASTVSNASGNTLFLDSMVITPPTAGGLSLSTPTFVILPASGPVQIDSLDGFTGTLSVEPGAASTAFYSGSTILQKWNALNRVKIVFDTFTVTTAVDAGPVGGCKAVDKFTALAGPAFKADLGNGQTCITCHGATGDAGAQVDNAESSFDLTLLDTNPTQACAEALVHVLVSNKPMSEIILTCTGGAGGDPTHPVRGVCGGTAPDPDAGDVPQCVPQTVIDGIQGWINAEN